MTWYQILQDGPEFEARRSKTTFVPPTLSLKDLRSVVPPHLFLRSTSKSLFYIFRHLAVTLAFFLLATKIDLFCRPVSEMGPTVQTLFRVFLWVSYWGWQGIAFAGIWCLGHDAGHDALSPYPAFNWVSGLLLHTFVLTPYWSWRSTHRAHHKATNNMERDETYVPATRKTFKLPDGKIAVRQDYEDILGETPAFTLFKLFVRQFFGFQLYLLHNRKGNPRYPAWTSHYNPSSKLFRPEQSRSILVSDVSIGLMLFALSLCGLRAGWSSVLKYYFMPWLFQHNWMVMFTYLQHTDPLIPYYRKDQWSFTRGCLATVDRPLFGWAGRFFLHGISTDHLAHHFFSTIPFYNLPQVTEVLKPVLGEYYNYDSTGLIYALWRSFTQCVFVEDEGDILFFKNRYGEALLEAVSAEDSKS
ncbi:fatty acid desaturase-domain-containing protein [Mycena floridula]|nr:fatty acid desaturase-domain-containing protein [Mycena floridula]